MGRPKPVVEGLQVSQHEHLKKIALLWSFSDFLAYQLASVLRLPPTALTIEPSVLLEAGKTKPPSWSLSPRQKAFHEQ